MTVSVRSVHVLRRKYIGGIFLRWPAIIPSARTPARAAGDARTGRTPGQCREIPGWPLSSRHGGVMGRTGRNRANAAESRPVNSTRRGHASERARVFTDLRRLVLSTSVRPRRHHARGPTGRCGAHRCLARRDRRRMRSCSRLTTVHAAACSRMSGTGRHRKPWSYRVNLRRLQNRQIRLSRPNAPPGCSRAPWLLAA
jgi:hypothetical protein